MEEDLTLFGFMFDILPIQLKEKEEHFIKIQDIKGHGYEDHYDPTPQFQIFSIYKYI